MTIFQRVNKFHDISLRENIIEQHLRILLKDDYETAEKSHDETVKYFLAHLISAVEALRLAQNSGDSPRVREVKEQINSEILPLLRKALNGELSVEKAIVVRDQKLAVAIKDIGGIVAAA